MSVLCSCKVSQENNHDEKQPYATKPYFKFENICVSEMYLDLEIIILFSSLICCRDFVLMWACVCLCVFVIVQIFLQQ